MRQTARTQQGASNDAKIVRDVLDGDVDAFSLLVLRYQQRLYAMVFRAVRSPHLAADLTQDAFVQAYEKLEQYSPNRPFYPWLHAVALNIVRDYYRKQARLNVVHVDIDSVIPVLEEPSSEVRLDRDRAFAALEQLPLLYREALILRYREELELAEVARALDIGLSAAKMRIKRGLELLRDLIGGE
ncbi:RNA polymerase sigma factor [Desulfovibrio mangrovi]|uniref:RNA polymerase sigma factor n=1 Tax=Desulfovibrio mangrovi TaxID=2976983 RepID=UPI002247349D|nr:RNA polymerase sigma factor [Desulfovibrio mangrovi]UZP65838.1 RNA polymerase sigma factor [Desulfovibrio mangrovi]